MARNPYNDTTLYLFKGTMTDVSNQISNNISQVPIVLRCSELETKKGSRDILGGMATQGTTTTRYITITKLDLKDDDVVSFSRIPRDEDLSMLQNIQSKPLRKRQRGSKERQYIFEVS